ncbi:MAG: hypothetical protein WKF54_04050 [Nocardioidaceae bacterium]
MRISPRFRQVKIAFAAHTPGSGPAMGLASDGKRLFETLDGARTWLRVSLGANPSIGDFAFADHAAYAVVGTGSVDSSRQRCQCRRRGLHHHLIGAARPGLTVPLRSGGSAPRLVQTNPGG